LITIPDAVGSGQRTNSVVTPSGSTTFSYGVSLYNQGSVPPFSSALIIPVKLSTNQGLYCGGNAGVYVAASLYLPEYGVSFGIMLNTHDGSMMVINDLLNIVIDYIENNPSE